MPNHFLPFIHGSSLLKLPSSSVRSTGHSPGWILWKTFPVPGKSRKGALTDTATNCCVSSKTYKDVVKKTEQSSSWCWTMKGQNTVDISWRKGAAQTLCKEVLVSHRDSGADLPETLWCLCPWRFSRSDWTWEIWYDLGAALALSRSSEWKASEVSSDMNVSVILCLVLVILTDCKVVISGYSVIPYGV